MQATGRKPFLKGGVFGLLHFYRKVFYSRSKREQKE